MSGALITLNIFCTFFTVNIAEFEQAKLGPYIIYSQAGYRQAMESHKMSVLQMSWSSKGN